MRLTKYVKGFNVQLNSPGHESSFPIIDVVVVMCVSHVDHVENNAFSYNLKIKSHIAFLFAKGSLHLQSNDNFFQNKIRVSKEEIQK